MQKHHEPTFDFQKLSPEAASKALVENKIGLTLNEALHFQRELGRPLTLTELTIINIQGSEHCSYRSSRKHLKQLPTKGKAVIMGPGEDAGIVEIAREKNGKRWGLVIGHESHNHPSQIVPYEGAATGVGGIVRDIVCMGARVIGALDCLRFGDLKSHTTKWLTREVVSGISGYGNPIGVPNLGGDLEYDASFDANCLVNVIALGVLREDEIIHSYAPSEAAKVGYDIIIVGKPTDYSGFGGAAFASVAMNEADAEANKGAVQEPNPFLKRHLMVASYDLFAELKKRKLLHKVSFKDMGAGGNVCASVEQLASQNFGAEIDLEKIPVPEELREKLPPQVIACAETQERFCWVCHPSVTPLILKTYNEKWELPKIAVGARASVVGKVRKGNYVLKYRGVNVIDAPAQLLTEGLSYDRPYKSVARKIKNDALNFPKLNFKKVFTQLLASPNIASRAPIYEKYDKEVQGATTRDAGLGSSGIIRPLMNTHAPEELKKIGVTIGTGGNSSLGKYSARLQALHAVTEAIANVIAIGATPLALTDCLNYGNPEKPEQMAELVDGIAGLKIAAEKFQTPYVSGNVSLYNENGRTSINPSALVACVGRIENAEDALPSKFQRAGNLLVLVGTRAQKLGGSELLKILEKIANATFEIDVEEMQREFKFVLAARKLVTSARDLHRGGVGIGVAEMSFGTTLGVDLDARKIIGSGNLYAQLFAENPGFVLEIAPQNLARLKTLAKKNKVRVTPIGSITSDERITIRERKKVLVAEKKDALEKIWANALREQLMG